MNAAPSVAHQSAIFTLFHYDDEDAGIDEAQAVVIERPS